MSSACAAVPALCAPHQRPGAAAASHTRSGGAAAAAWQPSRAPHLRPRPARRLPVRAAAAGGGAPTGGAPPRQVLEPRQRSKLNAADDRQFYAVPRIGVHHLDARFRAQLTELFRQRIPEGASVLDLCSSWVSHLPQGKRYGRVVCHGLSAAELAANRQATDFFVRNLNTDPTGWALADSSIDAVVCTAGAQYMEQPEAVFGEIARVLRPGGVCIVAFSNRMFYEKAIAAWRDNSDWGRCQLVKSYFAAAGGTFSEPEVVKRVEVADGGQGVLQQLQAWAEGLLGGGGAGDPFFAVVAYRQ